MNEVEYQAQELLRQREWVAALGLFEQLLSYAISKCLPKERLVSYLLGHSECCLELGKHEIVVVDCRRVIKLLNGAENSNHSGVRARRRLVHALFTLQRFAEAEAAAAEWIAASGGVAGNNIEAAKILERVQLVLQMADGQTNHKNLNNPRIDEDMLSSNYRLDSWITDERTRRNRKHPVELIEEVREIEIPSSYLKRPPDFLHFPININNINMGYTSQPPIPTSQQNGFSVNYLNQAIEQVSSMKLQDTIENKPSDSPSSSGRFVCSYCCLTFSDQNELRSHCQSETHQRVIMSDEGRDWKWRPPPRGYTAEIYSLCESYSETGTCRYGAQCVEAHGPQELLEWRERFQYRRMKLERASQKELYGKSYTEQLLERWVQSTSPDRVMREKIDDVEDSCSDELVTTVASKTSQKEWNFTLQSSVPLRAVALLQDAHRNHFILKQIVSLIVDNGVTLVNCKPANGQEWTEGASMVIDDQVEKFEHRIQIEFSTDIYGTFRQSVVFNFGTEPVLVKHICVDVVPVTDANKIKEIKMELVLSNVERWDNENCEIVSFKSPSLSLNLADVEREKELIEAYPAPRANTFTLTQSTVSEKRLTKNNYRARMHELLCVEEMARYEQVARYNLAAPLRLANCYLLSPSGVAASTAKYSVNGELYALMNLGKDVSEDTSAGRLILNNCTNVLLAPAKKKDEKKNKSNESEDDDKKKKVYEALIEDKGKNVIYLRLSADTVKTLKLKPDTEFMMDVQFQLNRVPYCEWHHAIDKIADFRIIFPETYLEPNIPWTPQRQWSDTLDSRLNLKQKEAVVAITTPISIQLPPILIIGPFGTGKTFTLAQAMKEVLLQSDTRVLICTHSNSAADLYIKDYLHPYVEAGHSEAKPLRIYYHKRWVSTVNQVVQKYCLIETNGNLRSFRVPTLEEILKHRVVVVTLNISMYLSTIGLRKGHFTHILLDEAAQAMECEAIMPLALANEDTRIVLAGDHMQLSPELFSQFAKERQLHVSLLERLYDHYPTTFPCKILLCENYRAHEAIIQFTSELFYDQKLISSGKQPRHEKYYPLTFFTTRGEDVQDRNSTAFYNNSEVYEVVERVSELKKQWPSSWGKLDEHSIGIMTPYADQVFRIRSELRKRRMGGISVERVLNVQGKQFRAIFLSTVRTRRTCDSGTKSKTGDEMDYGFLSNSKLLNTAITRAQSLVAVIGDPVALCSIGRCRKVWERFIEICNLNNSLFGIKWSYLRSLLDGVELKKTYTLNPLAPEFVPRQLQPESYIRYPSLLGPYNGLPHSMRFPPPPFLPPGPIYPAVTPMYYSAFQPPPGSFFNVRPPPVAAAASYSASNPWGISYPSVITPSTGTTAAGISGINGIYPTANGWVNKKKPEMSPPLRREEIRPPPGLLPPHPQQRATTIAPSAQTVFTHQPPTIQQVSAPAQTSPSNQAIELQQTQAIAQTYIRNPISLPPFLTSHPPPPPQAKHPQLVLEHQRRVLQQQSLPVVEKVENVQFLPNVHFSERQLQINGSISSLLPENVSLSEMVENQTKQMEWYAHLMDTAGAEAASKFMELVAIAPRKASNNSLQSHILPDTIRSADDLFTEKPLGISFLQQNGHANLPQMSDGLLNQLQSTSQPQQQQTIASSINPQAWFEKQIEKPTISTFPNRDIEASLYQQHILQQQHLQSQQSQQQLQFQLQQQQAQLHQSQLAQQNHHLMNIQRMINPEERFDLWDSSRESSNSVPLYQRQSQQLQQNTIVGNHQDDDSFHSLLEDCKETKQINGSAGAFAGYARAYQPPNNGISFHAEQESVEEMMDNMQHQITYASVLRTQKSASPPTEEKSGGDPFAILRDLGNMGNKSTQPGLYHYFS